MEKDNLNLASVEPESKELFSKTIQEVFQRAETGDYAELKSEAHKHQAEKSRKTQPKKKREPLLSSDTLMITVLILVPPVFLGVSTLLGGFSQ